MADEPVLAETEDNVSRNENSSKHLSSFLLGGTCGASLMHLGYDSEPYAYGAVSFLLVKTLLKSLEGTLSDPPGYLVRFNGTVNKLSKFVPWALLNTEMFRRSGRLNNWNEAYFGFLMAASVPTALAAVELKESRFNSVVSMVNVLNLAGISYLAVKQQNAWGIGLGAVCALDCFLGAKLAGWSRLSESNMRNMLRCCFAGMIPFYLKSL
ncbi:uncharacterized protein LOC131686900 [Topomyia yanbarensis]|uniref:uncharacterized protein LOC131686900 n=1 Tax=Topomyia yanbarensis TaxID=2498891 RepID=UPI00273C9462|nr:uncharacterized protein LOC131686900 [Topomyia yanbarensis]